MILFFSGGRGEGDIIILNMELFCLVLRFENRININTEL